MKGSGKTASGAGLYTWRKRRVGRCRAPSPKGPHQTRRGRVLAGSRKGPPLSPSARL